VYRNPHKDKINRGFNINKETLAIDPGENIFETIYNKGRVTCFMWEAGSDIICHLSWMQKDRDNKVNSMDSVNGKKRSLCA
jgi:hypothetical protein